MLGRERATWSSPLATAGFLAQEGTKYIATVIRLEPFRVLELRQCSRAEFSMHNVNTYMAFDIKIRLPPIYQ